MTEPNYTLGRGELHFARFADGTTTPNGFRYIGNTPEFSLTIQTQMLDHFSSDRGIREKDNSVPLETTRTGSFTADDIQMDNLALFFFGSKSTVVEAGAVGHTESLDAVNAGLSYQLGFSDTRPAGARKLANVVVKDDTTPTPVTFVAGTDYTVDTETGILSLIDGGDIVEGTNLRLTYDITAASMDQVISGTLPVEGALQFRSYNPEGARIDYYFPYIKVSPNGDFALKGDDWQTIPFNIEILKLTNREAIYANGRPYIPS